MEAAVADAHRREWAFVLAATVRVTGDIDLAEECVQDAYARALASWSSRGIPANPGAWLTTVARRRAIDVARRDGDLRACPASPGRDGWTGPDPKRRCARDHRRPPPADLHVLSPGHRHRCPGSPDPAAAVRPDHGRGGAGVPGRRGHHGRPHHPRQEEDRRRPGFRTGCPAIEELPSRIDAVLTVVHLLFTTGHTAPVGCRSGAPRPGRAVTGPGPHAAHAAARRCRRGRPAGPDTPHRRPARDPARGGRAHWCCWPTRTGPDGTWPPSTRASPWCGTPCGAGRRDGSH